MTGRGYMGEVLIQFACNPLEMSELLDKQLNTQKEKTSGVHASSLKPT